MSCAEHVPFGRALCESIPTMISVKCVPALHHTIPAGKHDTKRLLSSCMSYLHHLDAHLSRVENRALVADVLR